LVVSKIKVLVVDDEPVYREILTKRLTRRMLDVSTAGGGDEALESLADREVDVVLLDVKMPGRDGIEICREIKRTHPLVEVIMLTGHADLSDAVTGMRQGAFDYLLKPVDADELVNKIEDAAARRGLQQAKIESWRAAGAAAGADSTTDN